MRTPSATTSDLFSERAPGSGGAARLRPAAGNELPRGRAPLATAAAASFSPWLTAPKGPAGSAGERSGRPVPTAPSRAAGSPATAPSASRRAPRLAAIRRAATELAAHRRRLLEASAASDLDPSDALLLRVEPAEHRAGLARIAEAALAVAEDSHLTQLKAAAGDSRPPLAAPASDLQPTDLSPRVGRFAARQATGLTPAASSTPPGRGADMTQNQEENH